MTAWALWMTLLLQPAAAEVAADRGADTIERRPLASLTDVQGWNNGSPDETRISAVVKDGRPALLFANVVDHTKGEKNYPVGWPRVALDLARQKQTDWREWDFFECSIRVDTDRPTLPSDPLGIGFYHSGPKQSTPWPVRGLAKGQWTTVVVPIDKLARSADVQRVQFHISESNYRHGDRIDFSIAGIALARYRRPAIGAFIPERTVAYGGTAVLRAEFQLLGRQGLSRCKAALMLMQDGQRVAEASCPAERKGEIELPLAKRLTSGDYELALEIRDEAGVRLERQSRPLWVLAGPLDEQGSEEESKP